MINIPPIKPSAEIRAELLPDISKTWKIGQVLNATVESGGEALHKILLRIGQLQVETRAPLPLKHGDQIKLLVKSLGETPLLSIQGSPDKPALAAEQLRGVIARQQDLGSFMQLARQRINDERLPAEVQNRLRDLLRQLPDTRQLLDPQQFKRLVKNSGIFLEPRLLQNAAEPARDIKAQLMQLGETLRQADPETARPPVTAETKAARIDRAIQAFVNGNTSLSRLADQLLLGLSTDEVNDLRDFLAARQPQIPPALAVKLEALIQHLQQQAQPRQLMDNLFSLLKNLPLIHELKNAVDQALAKITSQQLMPLTRDADSPLLLMFDLPVREKDRLQHFQFRIEEENHGADKNHNSWTVTLYFDMPPLGPVQARLHLIEQSISTVFQAEKTATAKIIRQHMELLKSAYVRAGFQVGQLDVINGRPQAFEPPTSGAHIVDEKA